MPPVSVATWTMALLTMRSCTAKKDGATIQPLLLPELSALRVETTTAVSFVPAMTPPDQTAVSYQLRRLSYQTARRTPPFSLVAPKKAVTDAALSASRTIGFW